MITLPAEKKTLEYARKNPEKRLAFSALFSSGVKKGFFLF
jgi:hypothetical protein